MVSTRHDLPRGAAGALGLPSGTIAVWPHDARWAALFEVARGELETALGRSILAVHHVGSTAVPDLCAKPILDILVLIDRLEAGKELIPALARLGYEFRPEDGVKDRLFFRRLQGSARTHHLSLAEPDSHYQRVTLAFRDALRTDRDLAARYGALKQRLAGQFPTDRPSYQDGKTQFVIAALAAHAL